MQIPPGLEADFEVLADFESRAEVEPDVRAKEISLIQRMLERLREGEYRSVRGTLQTVLGIAYTCLPTGDRATNLEQAISCYQEALRFVTAEGAPQDYAGAQNNLGLAYAELAELPAGDPEANLQQAIACYAEALRFWTAEAEPLPYAGVQTNLAHAYSELPTGDPEANLRRVIACYTEVLRVRTEEGAPGEYAKVQADLGNTYAKLPKGDRTENVQQAIVCYEEALRVWPPETKPHEYAVVQVSLGDAYSNLPIGDRDANLEKAIACYTVALPVWTADASPYEYAMVRNSLSRAYADLLTGDREANVQRAIACCMEALRFLTADATPLEYASVQNNLGLAFSELPTGDPEANLQQAIACYEEALRVWTAETAPNEYASVQTNLASAYALLQGFGWHSTDYRAANLQRAIACYEEALRFRTAEAAPMDYARTQYNLGGAYLLAMTGDPEANLRRAIACYEEALRFRTAEADPHAYADAQNGLAHAYAELTTGDRAANLEHAIACYIEALRFRTLETAPARHRSSSAGLALLHFREGWWEEAQAAYASAMTAVNLLYQATATEAGRRSELGEARVYVVNNAYCLARLGRLTEAVECLEGGRARALAEELARDRAAVGAANREDKAAFGAARDRIKVLEAIARAAGEDASRAGSGRSFVDLSEALATARSDLAAVVARIRGYVPEFMPEGLTYAGISASATQNRPLVYLLSTIKGSLALIVANNARALGEQQATWLDGFTSDELNALLWEKDELGHVGGLLAGEVAGNVELLEAALERSLGVLGERLMGPLAERLGELGFSEATIVPVGRLSLLPLTAAAPGLIIALAPSARALNAAGAAVSESGNLRPVVLAVGNPSPLPPNMESLVFAGAETEEIGALFGPDSNVLTTTEATRDRIQQHLAGSTHVHLACHGGFDPREPLDSGLVLAGGERLTLRDLLDEEFDLSAARLAVLSACQTGITEFELVPDEAIGLPAGFLQAGVSGVVSTLWPVNDVSTALLVVEFYRVLLAEGLDPASALHRAQGFLRTSTAEQLDLAGWFERRYQASAGTDVDAFETAVYYRTHPDEQPFDNPRYWAGFIFSGV